MKNILFIAAAFTVAFSISSCKKDKKSSTSETEFSGTVELSSPHEGDTLTGNIHVTGTITGNEEMHGYHIGVYRTDNQDLIYENQYHDHASSYAISETVAHTLADITSLKVVVEAVADHEGTSVTKTVNFIYKP